MSQPEIGVGEVTYTDEGGAEPAFGGAGSPLPVVHWHGDAFVLPEAARLLASSNHCAQQAFRWGAAAFGLQFHAEMTSADLRKAGPNLPAELSAHERLLPVGAAARERFVDQLVAVLARRDVTSEGT
jgi:GMP synthase-like glutamine amidotransferase